MRLYNCRDHASSAIYMQFVTVFEEIFCTCAQFEANSLGQFVWKCFVCKQIFVTVITFSKIKRNSTELGATLSVEIFLFTRFNVIKLYELLKIAYGESVVPCAITFYWLSQLPCAITFYWRGCFQMVKTSFSMRQGVGSLWLQQSTKILKACFTK